MTYLTAYRNKEGESKLVNVNGADSFEDARQAVLTQLKDVKVCLVLVK